ncbi:hypothetical protein OV079_35685 [Nannocystis pusilla]|uniref:Uncharacterized protein n=1 Tax=Nannocystis pusilla TaxID=889268 RepID=A0A9X3EVH6_9BACT|nr:hypothetical protein [Nannocystis pusilla]MCY1010816.1 hypothetical protein [Nannocystis pusilla]
MAEGAAGVPGDATGVDQADVLQREAEAPALVEVERAGGLRGQHGRRGALAGHEPAQQRDQVEDAAVHAGGRPEAQTRLFLAPAGAVAGGHLRRRVEAQAGAAEGEAGDVEGALFVWLFRHVIKDMSHERVADVAVGVPAIGGGDEWFVGDLVGEVAPVERAGAEAAAVPVGDQAGAVAQQVAQADRLAAGGAHAGGGAAAARRGRGRRPARRARP